MAIRILHQTSRDESDNDKLLSYVRDARNTQGCRSAELYRGLEYPENVAVTEVWSDVFAYSAFWHGLVDNGFDPELLYESSTPRRYGSDGSEFYEHQIFNRTQGGFEPIEYAGRAAAIGWPGGKPIRILVFGSQAHVEDNLASMRHNSRNVRRQPGCAYFEHFRAVDYPEHSVLVELWSDETSFDAHLLYPRRPSGPPRRNEQGTRQHGENGLELYRHESFVHLFGTWVADTLNRRSERLLWPN